MKPEDRPVLVYKVHALPYTHHIFVLVFPCVWHCSCLMSTQPSPLSSETSDRFRRPELLTAVRSQQRCTMRPSCSPMFSQHLQYVLLCFNCLVFYAENALPDVRLNCPDAAVIVDTHISQIKSRKLSQVTWFLRTGCLRACGPAHSLCHPGHQCKSCICICSLVKVRVKRGTQRELKNL